MHFVLSIGALNAAFVLASAQQTPDNLQKYTLTAPGINVSYIGYGARLTNLHVNDRDGKPQDVVLGYDQGSRYLHDTEHEHTYFGAVVGRYAGRMKNGTFTLNGEASHVTENENKEDSLHGGVIGYDQRNWTTVSHNETCITFMLEDNGLSRPSHQLRDLLCSDDGKKTLVNVLPHLDPSRRSNSHHAHNHPYWNLNAVVNAANANILDHTLHMPYSKPIDNIEVATGQIGMVSDQHDHPGLLDLTSPRTTNSSISATVTRMRLQLHRHRHKFRDRPRKGINRCQRAQHLVKRHQY